MKEVIVVLLLLAALAVALVVAVKVEVEHSFDFRQVCESAGGTTVWDGRQRQCIAVKEAK